MPVQVLSSGISVDVLSYIDSSYPKGSFTNLVVGGFSTRAITANNCTNLTNIVFITLRGANTTLTIGSGDPNLRSVSFPELEVSSGAFIAASPALPGTIKSLYVPKLRTVNNMVLQHSSGVQSAEIWSLDFPELRYILGSVSFGTWTNLTSISMPKLIACPNGFNAPTANLTNCVVGTVGVTKSFAASLTLTGLRLTTNCVNNLLEVFSSMDGTSNTIPYTRTINLSGGTSASSNGTNQAWINKLRARGATVILNVNPNYPN